ncbi:hypothetical protein CPB83DRAFT_869795 [Crepidotus variabilis]|uniref:C3H1-type domain-containing protein n=1 Tax=Crepidotus variabilis TaxID=179855 RepID=A0A9P6JPE9_9AGAR|nr:hypothetical protein CPB83DRAFT_869795 [Crepidotus variabilis]
MATHLMQAAAAGDLQKVQELLSEATVGDIESKDHTGVTALIEAVRNGHAEIVRALLEKGADPSNASSDGRPETYTSDPAILEVLLGAQARNSSTEIPPQHHVYPHDGPEDPEKRFYAPPPPETYTYYPTINPALSTMNDAAYYPPPPHGHPSDPAAGTNGLGHLPPPEIARMIPCRYFPACRYGPQCMFLHPQGQYYQGAMPPYPPYDPMGNPYGPHYYGPPPPSFHSPPNGSMQSMPEPSNPGMHARSPSEAMSPVPVPFSPNGAPQLPPPAPYGPIYGHPAQGPIHFPQPPPHSQPSHSHSEQHSPPNLYTASSPVTPYPMHSDSSFPPQVPPPAASYPDANAEAPLPENSPAEIFPNSTNGATNGLGHHRRGSVRRQSFGGRKPPCLFFPNGRCKNGDECRFPHVLPDGATQSSFPSARGGPPRPPRGPPGHTNGVNSHGATLADKLSNLNLRDDQRPRNNGVDSSSRSSSDGGNRPKFYPNGKHHHHPSGPNGHHHANGAKKGGAPNKYYQPQRVPSADDFPVLAGTVTPPRVNGHANGMTAAQVLQAPPPTRKEATSSKESSTRNTTPDPVRGNPVKV